MLLFSLGTELSRLRKTIGRTQQVWSGNTGKSIIKTTPYLYFMRTIDDIARGTQRRGNKY